MSNRSVKNANVVANLPDKDKLEYYRTIIIREFFPKTGHGKCNFSKCELAVEALSDFNVSPQMVADLQLTIVEAACRYDECFGDMDEAFYESASDHFDAALAFIKVHNQTDVFHERIELILVKAYRMGFGFFDSLCMSCDEYNCPYDIDAIATKGDCLP